MGWTAASGRYKAKRWYCGICGKRTPIELNPDWVAAGKPLKWEGQSPWEWFSCCATCGIKQWDEGEYDCPNCGCPSESPEVIGEEPDGKLIWSSSTLLESTKPKINPRYSYEYGVTGYDWDEHHKCRKCGKKWWFTNSSC